MPRWDEVRAIDWSHLEGAYGLDRDVPAALETLRFADEIDDEVSDAYLDVLYGHVWHQGTIYPVTAAVIPFLFDVVDRSPALASDPGVRAEIAGLVPLVAASARRSRPVIGRPVLAALARAADRLRGWTKSDLRSEAIAAMLNVPELARAILEAPEIDDGERLAELADAIPRGDLDRLRERFGIEVERRMDVAGEITGKVTVSDDNWFVVQTTRNVTVRWRGHPFEEGDTVVLVDIDARNVPREVRGTGDKAAQALVLRS